jgi:hypothetical protein
MRRQSALPSNTFFPAGPPSCLSQPLCSSRQSWRHSPIEAQEIFLASHDLEDITTVVDGRPELADEAAAASPEVRSHLSAQFSALLQTPAFVDALPGHLPGDPASQVRLPLILDRLRQLSTLA